MGTRHADVRMLARLIRLIAMCGDGGVEVMLAPASASRNADLVMPTCETV